MRRKAELNTPTGTEWIVDARDADPARLADPAALATLLERIVSDMDLTVVGAPLWHVFPGAGGVTGLCLLAESHLAVHTFPEHRSLCLNLFCCRDRMPWDFQRGLREIVGAAHVRVRQVERRYASEGVEAPLWAPPVATQPA
jgi:S-adenosylmethionine decarboxylase